MLEQGRADKKMVTKVDRCPDYRRYNAPTAQEITHSPERRLCRRGRQQGYSAVRVEGRSSAHYKDSPCVRCIALCPTIPSM